MNISRQLGIAALLTLFLVPSGSWAAAIFGAANLPVTDSAACSPLCPELTTATAQDQFTLAAGSTITGFTFWTFEAQGAYAGGLLDWRILSDLNGAPGTILTSGQFSLLPRNFIQSLSVSGLPVDEYQNDVTLPAPVLINPSLTSQNYFLQITDLSAQDSFGIFWASSSPTSLAFQILGSNDSSSSIPEPGSCYMAGSALLGLAAWRRSRAAGN